MMEERRSARAPRPVELYDDTAFVSSCARKSTKAERKKPSGGGSSDEAVPQPAKAKASPKKASDMGKRERPHEKYGGTSYKTWQFRAENASHKEPLRGERPTEILENGFAECSGLLPADLCAEIAREPMVRRALAAPCDALSH